jgi:hypothetical protein
MHPLLATSYEGLYEALLQWQGIGIALAAIAFGVARLGKRGGAVCGIVLSVICCILVLPPTFVIFIASAAGGGMAPEWFGLIFLTLAACGSAVFALFHAMCRLRMFKKSENSLPEVRQADQRNASGEGA